MLFASSLAPSVGQEKSIQKYFLTRPRKENKKKKKGSICMVPACKNKKSAWRKSSKRESIKKSVTWVLVDEVMKAH